MSVNIDIDKVYCKGCDICITACPKGVFSHSKIRNNYGTPMPEATNTQKCTACRLCEKMCPDGCINVEEKE